MVQYTGIITTVAIAPTTAAPTIQPAGGWGSWIQPQNPPSSIKSPVPTGTAIYQTSEQEIQQLRSTGLITDETLCFYKLRCMNLEQLSQQTIDRYSIGIPSPRAWRAIALLAEWGIISRFSLSNLTISWIKIVPALPEAEIRDLWKRKILSNLTYVHEVLNFERAGSVSSEVATATLYAKWQITNLMLGDALVSLESKSVLTSYIDTVTVNWPQPLFSSTIAKEELIWLLNSGKISNTFYAFCASRSEKATPAQNISSRNFLENWAIAPSDLLSIFWRLRERQFLSQIDTAALEITWLIALPPYNQIQAKALERTFLKDAGFFLFAIAADNPKGISPQPVNIRDIMQRTGIRLRSSDPKENTTESGINLLVRMIANDVISVSSTDVLVTWAS